MAKYVGFAVWVLQNFVLAVMTLLVHAQDQSGFISIDCGSTTGYSDDTTGINYVPDAYFIDTGESKSIDGQYKTTGLEKQFENVRSFPNGDRNCYTLKPPVVNATQYLIRARFMYGNYDSLNSLPQFDVYIGGNLWTTVTFDAKDQILTKEILQLRSPNNATHICLVNKGLGTPFISVLELRLMDNALYPSKTGSLSLYARVNLGSDHSYRYESDPYDRIWRWVDWSDSATGLRANRTVFPNKYKQPLEVISTAIIPAQPSSSIAFTFNVDIGAEYYVFMHFAEVQIRALNDFRRFYVSVNESRYGTIINIPSSSAAITAHNGLPLSAEKSLTFTLSKTPDSTLPPILNALEIYQVHYTQQRETDPKDAEAVINIKSTYNLKRTWQGDPCAPQNFTWKGLYCSFVDGQPPRILTLNLTSSNLNGEISHYISDLKLLQKLDLSNNNLSGQVPDFLSQMTSLNFVNLSGNKLTGTVPSELVRKMKEGSLTLNVEGNPNLCLSSPCDAAVPPREADKKSKGAIPILIPIVGTGVAVLVVILVVLCLVLCMLKQKN